MCARFDLNQKVQKDFLDSVYKEAKELHEKVNGGKANDDIVREEDIVLIDCWAGVMAERLCLHLLNRAFDKKVAIRPPAVSPVNQIDIQVNAAEGMGKTLEVRSSFPRNGIQFALFRTDEKGVQYFDAIGPYHNTGHKQQEESIKDFYMRILFPVDKNEAEAYFRQDTFSVYVTGGATGGMMSDESLYRIKALSAKDMVGAKCENGGKAEYRTIPLAQSLDIREFLQLFAVKTGFSLSEVCQEGMKKAIPPEVWKDLEKNGDQ